MRVVYFNVFCSNIEMRFRNSLRTLLCLIGFESADLAARFLCQALVLVWPSLLSRSYVQGMQKIP